MYKKKSLRVVTLLLLAAIVVLAGYGVYSMTVSNPQVYEQIEISEHIQTIIRNQYPQQFSHYLEMYKRLLFDLHVSPEFHLLTDTLLEEGYMLTDVLTAYDFLYQQYGTGEELRTLLQNKRSGQSWETLFQAYLQNNSFMPRAFDSDYLEELLNSVSISSDDIMISDRLSYESGANFEELLNRKMEGESWQQISTNLNILNSADQLPRVEVTQEKLDQYRSVGLTDDQTVNALVLADKLSMTEQTVIDLVKAGQSEAQILATGYLEKYR